MAKWLPKYLVLVNNQIYEYTNVELLRVSIAENKNDRFELWKQDSTLSVRYVPMDASELEPAPITKCRCGNDLWRVVEADGTITVAPCVDCQIQYAREVADDIIKKIKGS